MYILFTKELFTAELGTTQVPNYRWVEIEVVVKIYSARRKQEILPIVTIWIELKGVKLSEIDQKKRDKDQRTTLRGSYKETEKDNQKKRKETKF